MKASLAFRAPRPKAAPSSETAVSRSEAVAPRGERAGPPFGAGPDDAMPHRRRWCPWAWASGVTLLAFLFPLAAHAEAPRIEPPHATAPSPSLEGHETDSGTTTPSSEKPTEPPSGQVLAPASPTTAPSVDSDRTPPGPSAPSSVAPAFLEAPADLAGTVRISQEEPPITLVQTTKPRGTALRWRLDPGFYVVDWELPGNDSLDEPRTFHCAVTVTEGLTQTIARDHCQERKLPAKRLVHVEATVGGGIGLLTPITLRRLDLTLGGAVGIPESFLDLRFGARYQPGWSEHGVFHQHIAFSMGLGTRGRLRASGGLNIAYESLASRTRGSDPEGLNLGVDVTLDYDVIRFQGASTNATPTTRTTPTTPTT